MIHNMKLLENEYNNIINNYKRIEVRLNDPKRQKIKDGDEILFYKKPQLEENILVKVKKILIFESFQEIYNSYPNVCFGYENMSKKAMINHIYSIYSKEQEKQYGVLAIEFNFNNK